MVESLQERLVPNALLARLLVAFAGHVAPAGITGPECFVALTKAGLARVRQP